MSGAAPTPGQRFCAGLKLGLAVGLVAGGLDWLGNWLLVSRLSSHGVWPHLAGWTQGIGGLGSSLVMLAGLPVLAFGVIGMLFRRARTNALACLGTTLAALPLTLLGINFGERVRHQAFVQLAGRSAPLVRAIHDFEALRGRPPAELEELIPQFLPVVPGTGLCAYPDYLLLTGEDARRFEGNPWVLLVPVGSLDFDKFLYLPRQNYPERGFGGWIQRMGEWAYVHE